MKFLAALAVAVTAFVVMEVFGLASAILGLGLVLLGALITVTALSIKGHPSIAYPDFPSQYVPGDRAPDTEDVTQAEAENAEAAA